MKKVGYIIRHIKLINGKEYEYFYLRRSDRTKMQGKTEKQTYLYSFGNGKKALSLLKKWQDNINHFPEELKDLGYDLSDVKKWQEEIERK